ncbi:phosphatidylserine/phosphatidylglycerophosphate/cardiolipin synthase family protein [Candidatus Riflebacteria bacterium]
MQTRIFLLQNKVISCISRVILFLLFISLCSPAFSESRGNSVRLFLGPVKDGEEHLAARFIKFLKSAKESIDGAFYEFRYQPIVDTFIKLHEKGIKIRLQTDSNNYFTFDEETRDKIEGELNPYVKQLLDAGIEVKEDNDRGGLMHNKFAIVDNKKVWTGSFNLTNTGTFNNQNNAVIINSKKIASIFLTEFEEMFVDRQFGVTSPSGLPNQQAEVGGNLIQIYFAGEDDPISKILELVKEAKKEVYFLQFAFTSTEIGEALVAKKKQGLKVKGIFDRSLYRSVGPYGEFARLTGNNVPVVVYNNRKLKGKLHHKVFIIDPHDANDAKVILGSTNTSKNGNKSNDENTVVIHSQPIAAQFYKKFTSLFGSLTSIKAEIVHDEMPFANSILSKLILHISANGKKVKKLNVEFPPRWTNHENAITGLTIFRNGKDTTENEEFSLTERGIYLKDANLSGFSRKSHLKIEFHEPILPGIPGEYNVYISIPGFVKQTPLKQQPVIEILDPMDESLAQQILDRFKRFTGKMESITKKSGDVQQQFLKDMKTHGLNTIHLALSLATKGSFDFSNEILGFIKNYKSRANTRINQEYYRLISLFINKLERFAHCLDPEKEEAQKIAKQMLSLAKQFKKAMPGKSQ